jgi:glycosyltransferase involved in cell wall biosynthesis
VTTSTDKGLHTPPLISVVVPVCNEEDGLRAFYDRTTAAVERFAPAVQHELVFVNDGSKDDSLAILRKFCEGDPRVRIVDLSRNFGHQIAITAGIDHARGDAVVVIDADLQDPPEVIAEMIERWQEGFKIVHGVRSRRSGESRFKIATAKLFYRLLSRLSDTPLPVDSGDFRLLDRQVVEVLQGLREENRYIRGLISWIGFAQSPVEYERDARFAGETKYTFGRMLGLAVDGITSFSNKPLRVSTQLGLITTVLTVLLGSWTIVGTLLHPERSIPGWASLMVVVLFLGGLQLLSIGVLGEYIGRTYRESKQRPLYIVAEKVNFEERSEQD